MDELLEDLQPKCVGVYIDDITVYSTSYKQHLEDLDQVFARLDHANLKVNTEKCFFVKEEVEVLGHLVNRDGILPNPGKISAIMGMTPPTDKSGVKSFLGVINFYRRFVQDCSTVSEPLVDLTWGKKGASRKFIWGPKQQASFEYLKEILASPPLLRFPDWGKEFWIKTDTSKWA